MKQTFIEWLEQETAFRTQMDFDYWLENLDTQEVIDRADEWMNVTREGLIDRIKDRSVNGILGEESLLEFINRK